MSAFRARPRRSVRQELVSLALLLAIPVALAIGFPYASIGFRAKPETAASVPHCAFVELSEKQERAALVAARSAWQVDARGVRGMRLELSGGELPPTPMARVLPTRTADAADRRLPGYVPNLLPPSVGAVAPVRLSASEEEPTMPAFSREELLQID